MNTDGFWWDIKIIQICERYDSANKMQIEQHRVTAQTVPHSGRAKKLEKTSKMKKQQNLKNSKVRFRLNIDVRKKMEDSRLNAIRQLIMFVKFRLNFSSKSTTAYVHLTESLLNNWLKNSNISVDILYHLRSQFLFQIYFPTAENRKTDFVATRLN